MKCYFSQPSYSNKLFFPDQLSFFSSLFLYHSLFLPCFELCYRPWEWKKIGEKSGTQTTTHNETTADLLTDLTHIHPPLTALMRSPFSIVTRTHTRTYRQTHRHRMEWSNLKGVSPGLGVNFLREKTHKKHKERSEKVPQIKKQIIY